MPCATNESYPFVVSSVFLSILVLILGFIVLKQRKQLKQLSPPEIELTPQEKKIRDLILEEKSNKEIADALFVSLSTVKTHINAIYKKENVDSRKDLISKHSNQD